MLAGIVSERSVPLLARYVEDVRVYRPAISGSHRVELLPDGSTSLMFRITDHHGRGDLSVIGPRTRAVFKRAAQVPLCVVIRFRAGAASSIVGSPMSELTDRYVMLEELWGSSALALRDRLLALHEVEEIVAELQRVLVDRVTTADESSTCRLVRRATRLWRDDSGLRVAHVATSLGVTARHLRRAFLHHVGVGAKDFARMIRLARVLRANAPSPDWARAAQENGYYDQSHLIAEFRDLLGLTPSELIAQWRWRSFETECPVPQ